MQSVRRHHRSHNNHLHLLICFPGRVDLYHGRGIELLKKRIGCFLKGIKGGSQKGWKDILFIKTGRIGLSWKSFLQLMDLELYQILWECCCRWIRLSWKILQNLPDLVTLPNHVMFTHTNLSFHHTIKACHHTLLAGIYTCSGIFIQVRSNQSNFIVRRSMMS